jgi:glycylpeptide N-tetradecanoyltransferase
MRVFEPITSGFNTEIETKTLKEVQADCYPLPESYEWCNVNMNDPNEAKELYELLSNHYVEDDGGNFRFDYSIEFLTWALTPPGAKPDWLIGVRGGKKKRLFGFISGIPVHMRTLGQDVLMAEINFLCVHK